MEIVGRGEVTGAFDKAMYPDRPSVLVGESGGSKSYIALTLAISKSLGIQLLDGFDPGEAGPVACLFGEDLLPRVASRIAHILDAHGLSGDLFDRALAAGRFELVAGETASFLEFDRYGQMSHSKAHAELLRLCRKKRYSLVVLDPLIAWAGLPTENDNAMMQMLVEALRGFQRASGGAVLAVHHTSKAGTGSASQAAARGGSALTCGAAWIATVRPLSESQAEKLCPGEPSSCLELVITKNSYARQGQAYTLRRMEHGVPVSFDARGDMLKSIAAALREILLTSETHLTERELTKDPKGHYAREAIKNKVGGCSAAELKDAVAYALAPSEGPALLRLETCPTRGRDRIEIVPI